MKRGKKIKDVSLHLVEMWAYVTEVRNKEVDHILESE